jgi:hypothetical protein
LHLYREEEKKGKEKNKTEKERKEPIRGYNRYCVGHRDEKEKNVRLKYEIVRISNTGRISLSIERKEQQVRKKNAE